jgi:[ribosomal protein S5]-alanine N-acetyltransferase
MNLYLERKKIMRLETKRLILRNFKESDLNDFFDFMSSESTAKYEVFEPYSRDECQQKIKKFIGNDNYLAIELIDERKVIGLFNFSEESYNSYEIGFDINEKYTRQGYATEAGEKVLEYIFFKLTARRITAGVTEGNIASCKLLKKLNFRLEGHFIEDVAFKKDINNNPIYINSYYYALLKTEYKKNCKTRS